MHDVTLKLVAFVPNPLLLSVWLALFAVTSPSRAMAWVNACQTRLELVFKMEMIAPTKPVILLLETVKITTPTKTSLVVQEMITTSGEYLLHSI